MSSSQSVNTILSYYGVLIYKLGKRIIRAKLIFTSILPRLVDHRDSESKVCKVLDFWCFNATFSNISAISWRPALVVEEAGVPGENHRPWASKW